MARASLPSHSSHVQALKLVSYDIHHEDVPAPERSGVSLGHGHGHGTPDD